MTLHITWMHIMSDAGCSSRYENLILIAGGIGISPFLAILRHIQHLVKANEPCKPKNVLVVWSVKTSKDLSLLSLLDLSSSSPFSTALNLDIQCYITRESEASVVSVTFMYSENQFC